MQEQFKRTLGTKDVMVSGIALVVAASTLVSDFQGYFRFGIYFIFAVAAAFVVNLLLGLSAADLSTAYPKAGGLYHFARNIFRSGFGKWAGLFIGITFFCTLSFVMAGEMQAGAMSFRGLFAENTSLTGYIFILGVLALIPNLLGIKTAAWASAVLLIFMIGIRWFFGIAGFLNLPEDTEWRLSNLFVEPEQTQWFGNNGILTVGFTLAIWSFIGIEFAANLAEETKNPGKSIPRGIIWGLVIIALTSLVMGYGVSGSRSLAEWQSLVNSPAGCYGDCPQLVVGNSFFGETGLLLMSLASVSATLGTLTVAFAAVSRVIYSLGKDRLFPGHTSAFFGRLHPKFKTPANALVLTFLVFSVVAVFGESVIDLIFSSAYLWIIFYMIFHLFSLTNRLLHPLSIRIFVNRRYLISPVAGFVLTAVTLYVAFIGAHAYYGLRALMVLGFALAITLISYFYQTLEIPMFRSVRPSFYPVKTRFTNKSFKQSDKS
ncbi:APC family permease [Gaoshiqia sp. Z1-71]|uniref:APC family permease n=1 Tax=Gaoshiqia hydrogeniformans TaxID=3290090 RepID=UPI003BF85A70